MDTQIFKRRPSGAKRRAAALVEFALILPLLVTIVLACVDFGRFAHYHIAVTSATGAGARFASLHPYTVATQGIWIARTRQAVIEEMEGIAGYDPAKLSVPPPTLVTEEQNIRLRRVRVEAKYTFETLVRWPLIPNSIDLTRVVEMRMVR